jgi:hypothetical protein
MTDLFLERTFEPALTADEVRVMGAESLHCFNLYRVEWQGSLLSLDGRRMVCWFQAPDADSGRTALRQAGADVSVFWPGTVHVSAKTPAVAAGGAQVVVSRSFAAPVDFADIQRLEDAAASCLESRNVTFLRTFFALDRRRMLCWYHAPDAESVRQAQHEADMPVERIWSATFLTPAAGATAAG